ncbi:MAG: PTS sugar transporter subunit IIA [Rubrivivax sp.]|nr:PTS sugar transporter subunit IIA [Rubrivivax sp.]
MFVHVAYSKRRANESPALTRPSGRATIQTKHGLAKVGLGAGDGAGLGAGETPAAAPANRLARLLPAQNVCFGVEATSKRRVFEMAARLFESQQGLSRGAVNDGLFERERLGSTGLGHGVAIPHARIRGLTQPVAAVLRVQQPLTFDAPDDEPVWLIVFLLVPTVATQHHLDILAETAELLSDRGFRAALRAAESATALHHLIASWRPDIR